MTNRLKIGQVAGLLDVSTKTIRHYQQQGLLPDRRDADNGYRHFLPADLLQLHKIMKLRELGMSLNQIAAVIKQGDQLQTMRAALDTLRRQLVDQKSQIEGQLARIDGLLSEETPEATAFDEPLPGEDQILATYQQVMPDLDPALIQKMIHLDRKLFALFKEFNWPGNPDEQFQKAMGRVMADPEKIRHMEPIIEGFFSLMEQGAEAEVDLGGLARAIKNLADQLDLDSADQNHPLETVLYELIAKLLPGRDEDVLAKLKALGNELENE
ncbi:MerR family transcriptional regulator [Acanthopleuribacter pedis]|uniref:MerR family transcriptional regulator n=1 Tax=Acanthopleuribacter pedis TaxID=442870 RepID=A0A8J7Q979_9BACT|nr:MerR family transcriptional regulator [Acanthopleuribacter pedis]MBO1319264.1 MerR family transcriptional regulator [Acanthopleuribacter pedis]